MASGRTTLPADQRLARATARLEDADPALGRELRAIRARTGTGRGGAAFEATVDGGASRPSPHLETIVLRTGRPVLAVVDSLPRFEAGSLASDVWRTRFAAAGDELSRAISAVGRIDVQRHPRFEWVGTGWLVDADLVVTNRHVAREFAADQDGQFVFRQGLGAAMCAAVDLRCEVGRPDRLETRVLQVIFIGDDDGPDVAVLRVEPAVASAWPEPIVLSDAPAGAGLQVAVIGYPARDGRVPDERLMQSIFGDIYDRKRIAPGQVTAVEATQLLHDCSTLGGNSGSAVIDLSTGRAVGLHFAGRFLEANYAVPADAVAACLREARRGGAPPPRRSSRARRPDTPLPSPLPPDTAEPFVETRVSDYVDRQGYARDFLGVNVPLPAVRDAGDVLTFQWREGETTELAYEHFSVVMSRSRRLCRLSAVNIDGLRPRRAGRTGWRLDPRIPRTQQIRDECYGLSPRFSRGHMTRREDPIWGAPAAAARGNDDSMHVTNAVPQMQPFNAGIWLGLENHALEHARTDDMRIAVFTGPFLRADDPVRFDVQVPLEFWKVIAFIHDDTGELCATGYTMSQEDFFRDEEFVFGQHQTWQTSIRRIEADAGIRFGDLAARDPFVAEEGVAAPLSDFRQIVFRTSQSGRDGDR